MPLPTHAEKVTIMTDDVSGSLHVHCPRTNKDGDIDPKEGDVGKHLVLTREPAQADSPQPESPNLQFVTDFGDKDFQARIPHLAQTSDAVNRQLSCFSSR